MRVAMRDIKTSHYFLFMNKNSESKFVRRADVQNKAGYTATQLRTGGQGPYLRSVELLGRSRRAKYPKNAKKVKCDGPIDGQTDGRTDKAGCRVA